MTIDDSKVAADYSHEYFIKETSHALPRYLIQYEYDSKIESAARQKHKCDDCEKELAVVYCEADKAYLCKSCDINLHKTKISKLHSRKPIGEGVDVFGTCKTHPSRQVQYFCSQCHEPVCIDCTIMGSHAKSEPGQHALVSVEDYFKSVLEESRLPNLHLNERRALVNDQISNVQSRADAVVQMGKQITQQIDEMCALAKRECNFIIEKKVGMQFKQKLTVLVGDEHELRREVGEIDRLERFLEYQQDGDSMNCVSTWHLHQMSREKLCDFRFFRQEIDVQLDAKINGKMSVVVDQDKATMSAPSLNSSPQRKPILPQRPSSPLLRHEIYARSPSISPNEYVPSNTSPSAPSQYGILSAKVFSLLTQGPKYSKPSKLQERKVERRTSVIQAYLTSRISFMRP